MAKKPPKIVPEWLDEDPDENQTTEADPYGSMKDAAKFHDSRVTDLPGVKDSSPKPISGIAQFCGQLGLRMSGQVPHLDLHGMKLAMALDRVDRVLNALIDDGRIKKIRIITGRGNHSESGGVLAKEIHPHIVRTFAKSIAGIDSSPAEVTLRGHPARGHFDLRLK